MLEQVVTQYLAQLYAIQQTGAAQPEQSYYPALQSLLVQAATTMGRGEIQAILQPQHQQYGVPDFQAQLGNTIIGWVEAKPLGRTLNPNSQQIKQYRSALHSLIFTNYLRFRLFINGESQNDVILTTDLNIPPRLAIYRCVAPLASSPSISG